MLPVSTAKAHSRSKITSPPIGGWNARDTKANMEDSDAVTMENWFPDTNEVRVRKGYTEHLGTSMGAKVETLTNLVAGSVSALIACGNGKIDNITTGTAVSIGTGFSVNAWQTENFQSRVFFVNGTDAPQDWDGSTLTATSWSGAGLTITNLINVTGFKGRLYFVEKDSQAFWYSGVAAVTGTLTKFDLANTGQFGGNLVGIGSLTLDAGDGVDDLFIAFMSSGEVIVYQGTDPSSDFTRVGRFKIGAPVGYRFLEKMGGDLIAITQDGYVPISQALNESRRRAGYQLSDKIRGEVSEAIRDYGTNDGWQILLYPSSNMLIINVPMSTTSFVQHIMNTNTGMWCKYTDIDSTCWVVYDNKIYFGDIDGKVYQAENGFNDNGEAILGKVESAFNYMDGKGTRKLFNAIRLTFRSSGGLPIALKLNTDFKSQSVSASIPIPTFNGAVWDVDVWDVGVWAGSIEAFASTKLVSGIGAAASVTLESSIDGEFLSWQDSTFIYERAGVL